MRRLALVLILAACYESTLPPDPGPIDEALLRDDFSAGLGRWRDWHDSPGWIRAEGDAMVIEPRAADHDEPTHPSDETYTFGALAVSCAVLRNGLCHQGEAWSSTTIETTMELRSQVREPGPSADNLPAAWEVGWLLFRFQDERHYYYVFWKTHHSRVPEEDWGGLEIGKYNCTDCGLFEIDPGKETLLELPAEEMPSGLGGWLELGVPHRWTVDVVDGETEAGLDAVTIAIAIDGIPVATLLDDGTLEPIWGGDGPTPPLWDGTVGLYAEDSEVRWDDVLVMPKDEQRSDLLSPTR